MTAQDDRATLVIDGRDYAVSARLLIGEHDWSAKLHGSTPHPPLGECIIRLPGGGAAKGRVVLVRGYSTRPDIWTGELAGQGPPPEVQADEEPSAIDQLATELAEERILHQETARRAEKDKATTDALTWLIAASVEVTIGVVSRGAHSELRVALDLEGGPPMWYGDLTTCLLAAKKYCESEGITP